jgi:hypothetical protein
MMRLGALTAAGLLAGTLCAGQPAAAGEQAKEAAAQASLDASAQVRRRGPARITVTPRRYGYPGPGAVRQCTSWLEPDYRPSGPVIVPRMRCWWVPG